MPVIEESVTIDRPVADVFSFISDAANAAVFDGSVLHAEQEGAGPIGVGTRWRGATKVLGRSFDWVAEYTECEPDQVVALKAVESKVPFAIRTEFAPQGDGTRLTYRLEADSGLGGFFGKIAEPLVVKAQTRTVRANLANLKELMESGAV